MLTLIPLVLVNYRLVKYKFITIFSKKSIIKFYLIWVIISVGLFILVVYLSGGINSYYYLERNFTLTFDRLDWNLTEHLKISIDMSTGVYLIGISILSGLIYSTVLAIPNIGSGKTSASSITTSTTSSITAGVSALASTTICCSTSAVALLTPTLSLLIGPFIPGLLIISMLLLIYSTRKMVFPRFPRSIDINFQ